MLALYRTLSLRYWRRRRSRFLLVVLSIALGVAASLSTLALNASVDRASRSATTPMAGSADLYVSNGDAGVQVSLAETLARVPGVRAVQPLVSQRVVLGQLPQRPVLLLGVDAVGQHSEASEWDVQVESLLTPQACLRAMFLSQKPVLLGEALDRDLPRDTTQLSVLVAGQVYRLRRAGTVRGRGPASALGGNVLVMECAAAAELLGHPDRVSRIDVFLEAGTDREAARRHVEAALAGGAEVWTPRGQEERVRDMLGGLEIGFALCGVGALLMGMFLVYNTFAVSVTDRRREIGILRSLGATRAQVVGLFAGEAALLGLLGAALGLPAGLGLAQLCLGPVQDVLGDVFLPLYLKELQVGSLALLAAGAAGVGTSVLAALVPALQAALAPPVGSLRRAPLFDRPWLRVLQLMTAGCLLLLALGWLGLRGHLPARLASYGSLILALLAAFLVIPLAALLVARVLQPLAGRLLGVPGRLAADNLVRAPARTGVVIAALAGGVALLFQTAGLIRSNEEALRSWVEQSIAGDLFITSGGPLSASGRTLPMAEGVGRQLGESHPDMRIVPFRFRYVDWAHDGGADRVLLVALDGERYYTANRDRSPPLPELKLYRRLDEPGTALVSQNFARLHNIRAGDKITLAGADGPVSLKVLGSVVDYSCNRGAIIVDRVQFRRSFDADLVDILDVYLPPGRNAEAVRAELQQSDWATERALSVLTRPELQRHVLGMVNRLYGLAYTQEVVVGLVAVLGVVAALLISVAQRRRELGLLRALGATRGQVLGTVVAEALLLGVVGTLLGLVLGLPLEWYTVRVLLVEEAGFVCPLRLPWAMAVLTAGLALGAATLAGLGPALHALREQLVDTIAYE